ncbi:MAG: hypothetical protein GY774_07755 [Planctomycetes bacterium]|nr:hypothetical protein [Planctomycetota bacterium]
MCKKLFFLTSFVLVLSLISTNVLFGIEVIERRISAGSDDAEEAVNPGFQDAYNTSSDLEITDDNVDNGGRQIIGMNFRDISIVSGAKISSAYIEFVCDETKDGTEDAFLLISGHLTANPDGFTDPFTISDRPMTQAKVPWEPEPWTAVGQISQTVDISSIIQELIDQEGWASGNAIEIIISEDTSKPEFTGSRTAESFNGSEPEAPLLHIEFIIEPVNPGTDGLAAFYALENDVLDSSGNGNDGTIVGAPVFVDGLADYGMAMEFDGESLVDCGSGASLDIIGPISMGIWIRPGADDPEGQGTEAAVMAKADSASSPSWSWQVRYGWNSPQPFMAFTFNTSPRAWVYVGQNLERDEWAHIACSHDGETLKCFLNGVETDSTPMGAITSSPTPVLIGSDGWRSDWIGAIDEVAIYDRALSVAEIRYLAGFKRTTPENLALNPSFEEDEVVLDDPEWMQWATWNPAEGAGSNATIVDTDAVDGARSLRIEPVGVENWHFIVINLPILVDIDKQYIASFWAKAEATRPLTVQMKAEDNSVNAWGATTFDLTTEWAQYSYTSEVLIDIIKVEFLCAGVEVPFLLDLFSVIEADTLSGLADVTVVDGAIESLRDGDTEYIVANGDLVLGTTTRWYVEGGVDTLWVEGDPAPAETVSGTSTPKEGDVGSKADNFLFALDGGTNISSIDGIAYQETTFPAMSDTFFLFERGGNDAGSWQAIYANGSLSTAIEFVKSGDGGPYVDTGVGANGQNGYGVVFKTSVPVQGVRITASGHDTLSISAVP